MYSGTNMPPHSFNSSVGGKKLGKPSRGDFFLYLDVFSLLALVHSTPDKSPGNKGSRMSGENIPAEWACSCTSEDRSKFELPICAAKLQVQCQVG
jgi:hypothetical protein